MTIQINIPFLIIIIVIINEVATHLLNWWMRRISSNPLEDFMSIITYCIKLVLLTLSLVSLVGVK